MNCKICKQDCTNSGIEDNEHDCLWFTEIPIPKDQNHEKLAMQIVNYINESTNVSVEVRQATNDANFDYIYNLLHDRLYY